MSVLATILEGIARAIVAVTGALASVLEGDVSGAMESLRGFFTWLADLLLPEWLDDFSLSEYFEGAFDFEWADMLPSWNWGDIIPDMPKLSEIKGWFGGDDDPEEEGPVPVKEKVALRVVQPAPTIAKVRANTGDVEQLQTKIAAVLTQASAMPKAVEDAVRQAEDAASLDLTAAGLAMMETLATGIRTGTAEVVAAVTAMARQVGAAMPTAPAVKLAVASSPAVQARASGGSFGAGWLLTGERGPELEYRDRGGFIAHNAQLQQMVHNSDTIRRNIGRAAPAGQIMQRATAAQAENMTVGDIHIHPAAGADPAQIARAVRRELARVQDARRGDLHDGVSYG